MRPVRIILATSFCLMGVALVHATPSDRSPDAKKKDPKGLVSKDTQKAIGAGLAYLAKEQHDDGSFGTGAYNGNVAVTSLAGLAFLSGGYNPDQGEYGKAVTKAVRNILSLEHKATPGFLNNPKAGFHGPMYGHGFGVLFLADSYAATTDKKLKAEVKETLERAVKLLVKTQNDEGGWRYQPRKADADISVTALNVVALRAARDAGFEVPKETFDKAATYVKSCQDDDSGGFRYQPFGGATPGFARSAAGLASLNRAGIKDGDEINKGMTYLQKFDPKKAEKLFPEGAMHYHYGHFYAAKAMWYAGDKKWEDWYAGIRDGMLESRKDGNHWESGAMCRHYCTSMALIILQMPNEHLPSLKR